MRKNNFKIVEIKVKKNKNTITRTVLIKDFLVNEIIGIHKHEKIKKQKIIFNVIIDVNQNTLPNDNDLKSIIDYEKITNKLKKYGNSLMFLLSHNNINQIIIRVPHIYVLL